MRISFFKDTVDETSEMQFAAMTFKLAEKLYYVAFRGTDASIVGWKEDFNLSFLKETPSQKAAAKYFRQVYKKTKGKYKTNYISSTQ